MNPALQQQMIRLQQQWQANRRLRFGVLIILAVLAGHALAGLSDRRQALVDRYVDDLELESRLQAVSRESGWVERADQAETQLQAIQARMPVVTGAGLAQAELQNWLTELAATQALGDPRVRVEDTLDVPDHPGMWQVLARLDGQIPQYGHAAFLRAASEGLPWIQVELMQIGEGTPAPLNMVVRGYYRSEDPDAAATPVPLDADAARAAP